MENVTEVRLNSVD